MSCGGTLVKFLLIILNFLLLGVSSFVVYLGIQTMQLENDANIKDLIDTNLSTGSFALIGLGGGMGIICAIGFIGACCESSCMLNFYGLLVFLLLIGNIALFFTGYRYKENVEKHFSVGIKRGINNFRDDKTIAMALQKFQATLKCCGWDGPKDYSGDLPASCCEQEFSLKEPTKTCSKSEVKFDVGCKNSPVIEKYLGHILFSAVALLLTQVIIILAACCLARDIRNVSSGWD